MAKLSPFDDLVDIRLEESDASCCFDLFVNEYLFHDSTNKKIPGVDILEKFVFVVGNALNENNALLKIAYD